jgi:hypothetical protein
MITDDYDQWTPDGLRCWEPNTIGGDPIVTMLTWSDCEPGDKIALKEDNAVIGLEKKRGTLQLGDAFAIPLHRGRFGYAQVVRTESFGDLFALLDLTSPSRLAWDEIAAAKQSCRAFAYVNPASVKQHWFFLGQFPALFRGNDIPPFFHGSSGTFWTVRYADGTEKTFDAEKYSHADMLKRGFEDKVIWLHDNIVAFLDKGKPLRWPGPV